MAATFTPPRQWEDWCDWALGIWLVLSPWILVFWKDDVALRNAVIVGALILLAEAITLTAFRLWEEWINVVLGVWLAISPWVLGITEPVTRLNFKFVGGVIVALAAYQVWSVSRGRPDGSIS
jgi:hypothetical protein